VTIPSWFCAGTALECPHLGTCYQIRKVELSEFPNWGPIAVMDSLEDREVVGLYWALTGILDLIESGGLRVVGFEIPTLWERIVREGASF